MKLLPCLFATISLSLAIAAPSTAQAYRYLASCGPTWDGPVSYYINSFGTNRIADFAAVEDTLIQSFDVWSQPCCSDFRSRYEGLTPQTALANDHDVVLSFSDSQWPSGFGGPDVIGLAIVEISVDCRINSAPIIFNSYHHNFDLTGADVDLQSVATHEVGHLLGLDHTQNANGTMFAHYLGGTGLRSLADVDVDGVCSLYPRDCDCAGPEDCRDDEICQAGNCVRPPCQVDSECGLGRVCDSGDCILPPCSTDTDCTDGLVCENERCLSACSACRVCETHDDCGSYGYCHPFDHGPRCMIACGTDERCPGDSTCTTVTQGNQEFSYCVAPNTDGEDHCPEDYICEGDDDGLQPCPGLGNDCRSNSFDCTVANDLCIERADESLICSCTCLTDADCGASNRCIAFEDGRACIPERHDPCDNIVCRSFEECFDGRCVDPTPAIERVDNDGFFDCSTTPSSTPPGFFWLLIALLIPRLRRP